jgi:1,4-alpha-glucan branching enzyme
MPKTVQGTRLLTAVVAALLAATMPLACVPAWRAGQKAPAVVTVGFRYVDAQAQSVCLSGSFNQWSRRSHCMVGQAGTWSIQLLLPPGRHAYGFWIDGDRWAVDPGAPWSEDSGFDSINSVIIVE